MLEDLNSLFSVYRLMPVPSLILEPAGPKFTIIEVNDAYLAATETEREDLIGKSLFEAFPDNPEDKGANGVSNLSASLAMACKTKAPHKMSLQKYDVPVRGTDTFKVKYWETENIPVLNQNGEIRYLVHTVKDVTDFVISKRKEKSFRTKSVKTENLLQETQELAKIGGWEIDVYHNKLSWTWMNKNIYEVEESYVPDLEQVIRFYDGEENRNIMRKAVKRAVEQGIPIDHELPIITAKGNKKWVRVTGKPDFKGGECERIYGATQDVTESRKQEKQLRASLEEKTVLLAEVHHRVKNNLAVVSSMMQLQAFEEPNTEVKEKLYDSIFRISTMATIHEMLYRSDSFLELEFSEVIEKLIQKIDKVMNEGEGFKYHIEKKPVQLNINQAIPCSLVINEVITNIYKHAFQMRDRGTIQVILTTRKNEVHLKISDNGKGFPHKFNYKESTSLGQNLIRVLTAQLEGTYNYSSSNKGTTFSLIFPRQESFEKVTYKEPNSEKSSA